jgi:hypothetical protein
VYAVGVALGCMRFWLSVVCCTLGGMGTTWTPSTPGWVIPSAQEVDDLRWIAYRVAADGGSVRAAGVGGALAWIRGDRTGPITARDEQPVTCAIAQAEMWAAIAMEDTKTPPPLELISARLGVAHWSPQPVETAWADGVGLALGWVTGEDGCGPPMHLPVRNVHGRVCTADELYAAAVATGPHWYAHPEQQIELRSKCESIARRSAGLAALIEDTRGRLAVA